MATVPRLPLWQRLGLPLFVAARPQFINGSWRKPMISRRKLAKLRKHASVNGLLWEEPPKNRNPNALKLSHQRNAFLQGIPYRRGHKHEREEIIAKRQKMMEEKRKAIPRAVAEHKKMKDKFKRSASVLKGLELLYVAPPRHEIRKLKLEAKNTERNMRRLKWKNEKQKNKGK